MRKIQYGQKTMITREEVGFLLSRRAREAFGRYKLVSSRIMAARFNAQPVNITVIQVCAPTADSTEEVEDFYVKLEAILELEYENWQ